MNIQHLCYNRHKNLLFILQINLRIVENIRFVNLFFIDSLNVQSQVLTKKKVYILNLQAITIFFFFNKFIKS